MKTVWIINQYASTPELGMGGRSYYLAKALAKKGYKVYLIASGSHHLLRKKMTISRNFKVDVLEGINFVWVKMPPYVNAHSRQRVLNWFLFAWRIQGLVKIIQDRPDSILISSPSLVSFLGAQRLASVFKAKLVFEVRDIWPLTLTEIGGRSPRNIFVRFLQWIEDRAYRDSAVVISNLKYAVEHMVGRGMSRDKFVWIPNGFCKDELADVEPLDNNILCVLPKECFLVGYVGTFGLANDLYTLLDAAKGFKSDPRFRFVLVGGGKEKEALESYIKENGIDNVLLCDFVKKKQVQAVLKIFDVLVVGAKKEPMYRFGVSPNKLFDYLIAGKPIIYHIESGDYHPVRDAGCGFEVEAENSSQLRDAVLDLYRMSEEQRALMGSKGRSIAIAEYEYGLLADRLVKVIF